MSTTPAKRRFRVGEGRTITLPLGLVEGAKTTRVHAADVECRHCLEAATAGSPAPHANAVELEHARIQGSRGGGRPYGRFVNGLLRTGDLVEIKDPPPAPAVAPTSPAPAAAPAPEPIAAHVAEPEAAAELSPADHARLAKETTP